METKVRMGVIGSRGISDYGIVSHILTANAINVGCLLSGGAIGVDSCAQRWAEENAVPFILFKPYFLLDPQAGYSVRHYFTRNKQIIDNSDLVIAISNGDSPGTKWGINYAKKRGINLKVYYPCQTTPSTPT